MALKGEYSKSLEISLQATARGFESLRLRQKAASYQLADFYYAEKEKDPIC